MSKSVRIVGYHGQVEDHTPAIREPVLAHAGRLVVFVSNGLKYGSKIAPFPAVLAGLSGHGISTRLPHTLEHRVGDVCLILGPREADIDIGTRRCVHLPEARRVVVDSPGGLEPVRQQIAASAFQQVLRALSNERTDASRAVLHKYSWWLSRAALSPADHLLSAAGLATCCGSSGWKMALVAARIGVK